MQSQYIVWKKSYYRRMREIMLIIALKKTNRQKKFSYLICEREKVFTMKCWLIFKKKEVNLY